MAIGKCLTLAAYRQTHKSSLQPGVRVGGHVALTDFRSENPVNLHMAGAVDYSTINIVSSYYC